MIEDDSGGRSLHGPKSAWVRMARQLSRTKTKDNGITRVTSGAMSTTSKNLCVTHTSNTLNITKVNDVNTVYDVALHKAGIDLATIFAAHQAAVQAEYVSDNGNMDLRCRMDDESEKPNDEDNQNEDDDER